jgi:glycosyltransferase involved in cell wall biosynthesis
VRNIPAYQPLVQSNRLRQHLGLDRNTRVTLYQGNLQADRGLTALVRAARFVDSGVVILMMGHGEMQCELEALIRQEGVGDRVKIIAPVAYQDLLEWTASADLGLILNPPAYSPNVRMCLPNKLFEYLMAGLPVLSAPLDAVADVLQTYDVGWILPSLEPEVIGHTINRMLADWGALAGMHRRSMNATRDELCWEHESQRLIHLYRQIVTGDRLGADGPDRSPPHRSVHI